MASRDVTYLFFQRDQGDDSGGFDYDSSPTIQSARVIKHGGSGIHSRAGSVPPAPLRAGSVPPRSVRAGSVAPRGAVVIATATPQLSPGGVKVPSVSTSSVRHILHRPPLQGAGSSRCILTSRGVIPGKSLRGDDELEAAGGSLASARGPINRRRASITVVTATPTELQQRSRAARDSLIYRADDFLSGTRNGPAITLTAADRIQPSSTFRPPTIGASSSVSRSYRRASVSGQPSFDRSTLDYSKAFPRGNDEGVKSTYQSSVSVNGDIGTPKKKTAVLGEELESNSPKESVSSLRTRMNLAREQMSRHRVLLDRYLPFSLGPSNDVQYEVENKVNELAHRMPQLDPTKRAIRSFDDDVEVKPLHLVTPYTPLPRTTKIDVTPLPPVSSNFTPKISDVRKRARNVLCKVKGDPRYFDF